MVRIERQTVELRCVEVVREVCTCDGCGVVAATRPGKVSIDGITLVDGEAAVLSGWGAVFVHQETPGRGDPEPLGYLCPECVLRVAPLFQRRRA